MASDFREYSSHNKDEIAATPTSIGSMLVKRRTKLLPA
jgi:hypothetical protein